METDILKCKKIFKITIYGVEIYKLFDCLCNIYIVFIAAILMMVFNITNHKYYAKLILLVLHVLLVAASSLYDVACV